MRFLSLPSLKLLQSKHASLTGRGHKLCGSQGMAQLLYTQSTAYVKKAMKMNEMWVIKLYELCPALKFIASDKAGLEPVLL